MTIRAQPIMHVRVVSGSGGGPDKTILRSPRYVDPQRYPMLCAYLYPMDDPGIETIRDTARLHGADLVTIPERGPIDLSAVQQLLQLCRQHRVAIWHGHDYKSDLLGLMLRKLHPMKLVTTAHGFTRESARTRVYYHVDNLAMRGYDHVIAVSPPLLEHCRKLGISEHRLSYVPNAIEPADYAFARRKKRGGDDLHLGVIGRFSVEKGVDRAIDLLTQLPQAHLHLVGDGPRRDALEAQARRRDVFDRITWHGWQKDVRPFYALFDLLLLPSHTEGLPNVLLEAMALGVPVAATDVGGVSELLDRGRLGVLLDPERSEQWAPTIRSALHAPPDTTAARQWIEQRYSFAARMKKICDVYDQLTQPSVRAIAA
ncbi:MAG: glycosyltransferase family 4 protein [Phycisphaeraceae bacterium]|nr:glycosyltransferase family 4 protein [Phycisphaeraceae bacterium]